MEESKEIVFARTLEEVKKLARRQNSSISKEQVKEAFKELELKEEQFQMIYDYLEKHKIGIGKPIDPEESLSEEEIDYLEEYKKEIAVSAQVSNGEKEAVFLGAMAGDTQAQRRLIDLYLPQVVEISKLYAGQGVFIEDLIGEGNLALSAAVTMLGCMEHAREAEGMLVQMIMDAMEECITGTVREMEKDRKVLEKVNRVADRAKELAKDLHRKVTVEELAAETGMSAQTIHEAMRMSGFAIEDIERGLREEHT
ncbi:MAG: hypothetical protein K2O16_06835 [Lachnospiraceae bacterium]|nr:hypothetical protein [Lachnospiraceae bacterium]